MPIYEYRCDRCGDFEKTQRISDRPLSRCPTCGRKVRRLISNTSFQLKGTGWYVTDYARAKGGNGGATADAKPGDAKAADAKPGDAKAADAKPGDAKPGDGKADAKAAAGDGKKAGGESGSASAAKPGAGGSGEKSAS